MIQDPRQFTIGGETYFAEEARVDRAVTAEIEDHGIIAVTLQLSGDGWEQGLQFGYSPRSRHGLARAMHAQLALQRFAKRWVGYVLRKSHGGPSGPIEGLRDFDINGGKHVLRSELAAQFDALPAELPR